MKVVTILLTVLVKTMMRAPAEAAAQVHTPRAARVPASIQAVENTIMKGKVITPNTMKVLQENLKVTFSFDDE